MPENTNQIVKELIKNNVELQHKSADLIKAVSELTTELKRLVNIFQNAAEKLEPESEGEVRSLIQRIDALTEQNKIIAKGLLVLDKYVKNKEAGRHF